MRHLMHDTDHHSTTNHLSQLLLCLRDSLFQARVRVEQACKR